MPQCSQTKLMVLLDSSRSTVTRPDTFDQQDSDSIHDKTLFDQQILNSCFEFEHEGKRCSQDLVSNLENLDTIISIELKKMSILQFLI